MKIINENEKTHQQLWGTILSIFRGLLLSNFTVKKKKKEKMGVGLGFFWGVMQLITNILRNLGFTSSPKHLACGLCHWRPGWFHYGETTEPAGREKFKSEFWEAVTFPQHFILYPESTQIDNNTKYVWKTFITWRIVNIHTHTHTKKKRYFTKKVPPGTFPLTKPTRFQVQTAPKGIGCSLS